ncbi:ATP-binding protein [Qipengyuania marisflavi]|uniref:histidine kinase n=1 Tax=Qipengyuania marisflavi TaxID=2486356 RepID=A0A5S3P5S1_9SPHN|nr:ATP-binding protein [Qipengyuania marisflavi]TMM48377.1 HAMP domain-containing protein [Qipengyuania marisflavi]
MRLLPRSMLGQVMLALAAALLIAQAISAVLLYRAAEQRRELVIVHAAAFQLLSGPRRSGRHEAMRGDRRHGPHRFDPARDSSEAIRLPRRFRYDETRTNPIGPGEPRDTRRERALTALLQTQGIAIDALAITRHPLADDPLAQQMREELPLLDQTLRSLPHDVMVIGLKQEGAENWQVARLPVPPRDGQILRTLVLQTLILFAVLVGLLYLVLRRITRPLAALAERTRRFTGTGSEEPPLPDTGPQDIRRLITAHNAMQSRIGAMLDEKDVMLGAIGHDLKTPLTALRVRIEGIDDETARTKMAATIEEITRTLDEILALSRIGRNDAAAERTDVGALAASVVEEFEDLNEPVELALGERVVAPVHLTWLKRGLRNLVSNALRYAGGARVSVVTEGGEAILRVDDDGPGIPESRIAEMLEPFTRGENSRNRETGGAGLGLALARAVAQQHGGTLVLANRPEGGLRAEIRIPLA